MGAHLASQLGMAQIQWLAALLVRLFCDRHAAGEMPKLGSMSSIEVCWSSIDFISFQSHFGDQVIFTTSWVLTSRNEFAVWILRRQLAVKIYLAWKRSRKSCAVSPFWLLKIKKSSLLDLAWVRLNFMSCFSVAVLCVFMQKKIDKAGSRVITAFYFFVRINCRILKPVNYFLH